MVAASMIGRKKMKGFPSLMRIDDALSTVKGHVRVEPIQIELVKLEEAVGRIAGRDLIAPFDVPAFDRSAVDGYAVRASDTTSASPTNPIELSTIGTLEAGSAPGEIALGERGRAVEIFTGAALPTGADAVVMAEFTKRDDGKVNVTAPVPPWRNVSRKGEDFAAGETIVHAGTRLRGWHTGALASVNLLEIHVYRRLRIAVLSTGSELRKVGEALRPGEIINSSKPMLNSLIKETGQEPVDLGIAPDDVNEVKNRLVQGLKSADIVITTGGSSVGERDVVPEAIDALGEPGLIVHGVQMRPGKPTGIGVVGGKPIFMLSGYPVAALVAFEVFVQPVIEMILGVKPQPEARTRGLLTRRVTTPSGVRSYVRVRVKKDRQGAFTVEPLRLTGSGILSSMTRANGILIVPEGTEGFDEGEEVEVIMIEHSD